MAVLLLEITLVLALTLIILRALFALFVENHRKASTHSKQAKWSAATACKTLRTKGKTIYFEMNILLNLELKKSQPKVQDPGFDCLCSNLLQQGCSGIFLVDLSLQLVTFSFNSCIQL